MYAYSCKQKERLKLEAKFSSALCVRWEKVGRNNAHAENLQKNVTRKSTALEDQTAVPGSKPERIKRRAKQ
jgi:hypothetical protein